MPICHFCQVSIKDYEKVCKQCLKSHGTQGENGGTEVIVDGEKIVYYETYHRPSFPKNMKLKRCLKCQIKCETSLCKKCYKENTNQYSINGKPSSITMINNSYSENFDFEINCENFNF